MPKSKNRRKSKSNLAAATGAQTSLSVEEASADGRGSKERGEGGAQPKKKSVGPVQFFRQVRAEMQKVTWTSRGEVMVSTIMVLIMVTIMCLFFFVVDQLLRTAVPWLLSLNLF